jgi:hypothetical protein
VAPRPLFEWFADGDFKIEIIDTNKLEDDTTEVVFPGVPEPDKALAFTVPHVVYPDSNMP